MTRHKHADLMIASANDSSLEIQFYSDYDYTWKDVSNPCWLEDIKYRIKPKKAKKGDLICEIDGVKWWLGPESPQQMTWGKAKGWAEREGCILPPREVLLMCYLKENISKQFKKEFYWSGEENTAEYAWFQSFNSGGQSNFRKSGAFCVRGVFCG